METEKEKNKSEKSFGNQPPKKTTRVPLIRNLSEEEIAELRKDMEESSKVIREYLKKNPI